MSKKIRYSDEILRKAASEVRDKSITAYQAQKKYNIPKTTLLRKLKGKRAAKHGSETVLSASLENQLADWVCLCAASGCPKTTKEILEAAKDLAALVGKNFKGGTPSSGWLKG